jgi:hypothetical protein
MDTASAGTDWREFAIRLPQLAIGNGTSWRAHFITINIYPFIMELDGKVVFLPHLEQVRERWFL